MTTARPLDEEFAREVRELHTQHEQCLADAPREESSEGGTGSKASCQALRTRPGMMQGKSAVRRVGPDEPAWVSIWPNSAGKCMGLGAGTRSNSNFKLPVVGPL